MTAPESSARKTPPAGETIAAIATPSGPGGVGIVRVSGPGAGAVLARLVGREPSALEERRMHLGIARDARGERLDEVLYVLMRGPRSFTGEDVAEVHGHGGAVNLGRLLRAALEAGARPAEPGEFSRRAFENGRIDLARAEAILDVTGAASERACRLAQAQLDGALSQRVRAIEERAIALRAEVEAGIDFPEEDLEIAGVGTLGARARELAGEVARLASTFGLGRALRDGIEVALRGPVNAGKSSLLNALCGAERALVDPEPGTTRDFVEARVVWRGVPVTLIDTAGERAAKSRVERRGIELGGERAARADLEVVLHPATESGAAPPEAGPRELHVVSKGDLAGGDTAGWLVTSAVTGDGIEALMEAILARVAGPAAEADEGIAITSERQRRLLEEAVASLESAADAAAAARPLELVADDLRVASQKLAEVRGEEVGEEMLDALFSRFCIGK